MIFARLSDCNQPTDTSFNHLAKLFVLIGHSVKLVLHVFDALPHHINVRFTKEILLQLSESEFRLFNYAHYSNLMGIPMFSITSVCTSISWVTKLMPMLMRVMGLHTEVIE